MAGPAGDHRLGNGTLIKVLCALILSTASHARVNGYDLPKEQAIKVSIGLVAGCVC